MLGIRGSDVDRAAEQTGPEAKSVG
jgi:hypothetical protein